MWSGRASQTSKKGGSNAIARRHPAAPFSSIGAAFHICLFGYNESKIWRNTYEKRSVQMEAFLFKVGQY